MPPNTTQTSPRHPQGIPREHDMPTDANRHCQRPQETDRCCLRKSGNVSWHLLLSVGISFSLGISGGVWEDPEGCLGVSEWYSWKLEALEYVWGVYGFSILAVWSENTILAQPWMVRFSVNWPYWDIKIPKPPHISLPKMIGLGHFLQFLGSSERYYLLQLLLITLLAFSSLATMLNP